MLYVTAMNGASKQWGILKGNGNKKSSYNQNEKDAAENKERRLGKLKPHRAYSE